MDQDTEAQASLPTISGTGLLAPSTAASTLAMLQAITGPMTNDQFGQVQAIAKASLPSLPGTGEKAFGEAMKLLDTLPRRKDDEDSGEVRYRVYRRCLAHIPAPQLWWTVEEALKSCRFYPSVKELLDLSAKWARRDEAVDAQRLARQLVNRELNRRHIESTRKPVPALTQDDVDKMDEALIKIGLTCGALVEVDGKVIINPEPEGEAA